MSFGPNVCIVNPKAGGGSALAHFREAEFELFDHLGGLDVHFTEREGHATAIAAGALEAGVDRIIVSGGDGTANEVLQAWFDEAGGAVSPGTSMHLLPGGTGGDLRRTLGITDIETAIEAVRGARDMAMDVGFVEYTDESGDPTKRYFLNIASMGLSGMVDRNVGRWRGLGASIAYTAATAQSLLTWRNPRIRLQVESDESHFEAELRAAVIAIANGRYFGGGMEVAPSADPTDGVFQVTVMGDLKRMDLLTLAQSIREGDHLKHPLVFSREGHTVHADSDEPVFLDIDGEPLGRLPARFGVLRSAIRIGVP